MSGTRSPSPRARAIRPRAQGSLLIVAHGERGGAGDDRLVHELADRLRGSGRFAAVAAGFIRSEPSVAEAAESLPAGPVTVYPLFMSAGYYVATAIPRALGLDGDGMDARGRPVVVAPPLGLDAGLPRTVTRRAADAASRAGIAGADATLMLVAHGSTKDASSRRATQSVAAAIDGTGAFARVQTAFLEEAPFLDDMLRSAPGPVVAVGLFVGDGMHGGEDLPQAVESCARADLVLAEPLCRSDDFVALVCDSVLDAPAPRRRADGASRAKPTAA